jgi:predicted TPR repeat methyltransferase
MNKGDAKAAAELFRSSVDAKWLVAKDQALFNLGSALAKAGDKKGAADAYRRIGAEVPKSQLKEKADARAKELDPQQPAPPPQAQ